MTHEVTVSQQGAMPVAVVQEMSIADIRDRKKKIHELMRELMVPEHHYGTVPGTDKPMLYKPGAEMLCMAFKLMSSFNVVQKDLADGHREYRVDCDLTNVHGAIVAKGVGSCSTMESKYRWRLASRKCPKCGGESIRNSKAEYGGGFYCSDRHGGCGAKFPQGDKSIIGQQLGKAPNPDLADQYNTCLKMAAKRAHSHAVLLATAASDIFVPEADNDDEPEEQPRQQGAKQSGKQQGPEPKGQKPAVKVEPLTPLQQLAHDCANMVKQLRWTPDEVQAALAENDVAKAFAKWSDLDEQALEKAKKMFESALKAGKPAEQQS